MHSALFNMKRVYLRSQRVPRRELKEYGLTPARFDILYALYVNKHHECFREDLIAVIGTVKSNIYRLCDALVELGLAKYDWEAWRIIKLTQEGIERVRRILIERKDLIEELVEPCAEPPEPAETKMERLINGLTKIRSALGDKHLFDIYDPKFPTRLWNIRVLPRAKKYFCLN